MIVYVVLIAVSFILFFVYLIFRIGTRNPLPSWKQSHTLCTPCHQIYLKKLSHGRNQFIQDFCTEYKKSNDSKSDRKQIQTRAQKKSGKRTREEDSDDIFNSKKFKK